MTHALPTRRRLWVLLVWLALLAAAGWQIARTTFTADLSAFLPAHPDERQRLLVDQLKTGLPSRTLMLAIDGGSAAERANASRTLAAALRQSGLFEQVQNGDTSAEGGLGDIGRWIFERRYLLSPAVDAQRFSAGGLADAIADTVSLLGTPVGNAIKPLLDRDPTGETQRIAETLIPAAAPRTEEGVWASRAGGRALLLAVVKAEGADLDSQQRAIDTIRRAFPTAAGLTLKMSGTPVFSVDSRARIESEVQRLAIAGTLLMSGLLLAAFASPKALVVALLPVATGVLAGVVAVSLGFGGVHAITLGFGSTLIGEAVDYAIYYLIQARAHGEGWRGWLRRGWPTVRLGLLTSVCGFAALTFSGFPGLAQLGVFSVAGLFGAALATRFVLPVLMPEGASGQGLRRHLARLAGVAVRRLPATRWLWLALAAAALAVLLLHRGALWQADLSSISPVPREAIALDEQLRAELSPGGGGTLVVVQGDDPEHTLQRTEAATAALEPLVEQGVLAGLDSVTRLLPSRATQEKRRAALPEEAALRGALAEATRGGPLKAERLAPFIAEVAAARTRPVETLESARQGPAAPLLAALIFRRSDGGWATLLPLQPPAGREDLDHAAVARAIEGKAGAQQLRIKPELDRLYARYLREAQTQALLGALGVVLLVALTLRSPRRVLAVCEPLALAVLLVMGALVALGVPLGILHLVGLLLVAAIGSNYALFFDLVRDGQDLDDDTLASLLLANLTTVLSFALIAASQIPALSAVGRVVAPGALLGLLLSAAFARRRTPV